MVVGIWFEICFVNDVYFEVECGIIVDDVLCISDLYVFVLGECVEYCGQVFGFVVLFYDQVKVLVQMLLDWQVVFFVVQMVIKLKVMGCDLFSVGDFVDVLGCEDIVFCDLGCGIYKWLVLENDCIIGMVMYGNIVDGSWFYGLMKDVVDICDMCDMLIFGLGFQGGVLVDFMVVIVVLFFEVEICGCNGVIKGSIMVVVVGGVCMLDQMCVCIKVSVFCGICIGFVQQVMVFVLGDEVVDVLVGMCKCIDYSYEDLCCLICIMGLKFIFVVMQELGWKILGGCYFCCLVLNYYLLVEYLLDYCDDRQLCFVNECNYVNIQKDGIYLVVLCMWGGVIILDELCVIVDVVDKYNVFMVKVMGGQCIDFLGVCKEDLLYMWVDLNVVGMVLGVVYFKGLCMVKICVGKEFCCVGMQDLIGLGIKLEKLMWGFCMLYKLKLGVSGCLCNCVEVICKDIGVVCVDSGYMILIGGVVGMEVKEIQVFVVIFFEDEVIQIILVVIQFYCEYVCYLDCIWKWMGKVGLDWIKVQVVEDLDNCRVLVEWFEISQFVYCIDLWVELLMFVEVLKWGLLVDLMLEVVE